MPIPNNLTVTPLRFIPHNVDLNDLNPENLKVYSNKDLECLNSLDLTEGRNTKASIIKKLHAKFPKRALPTKIFSLIKIGDELYAIYEPPLGAGGFGAFYALQNLKTGAFDHGIKVLKGRINSKGNRVNVDEANVNLEVRSLEKMEELKKGGDLPRRISETKKEPRREIIMKMGQGGDMHTFIKESKAIPTVKYIDTAITLLEQLKKLHALGLIHRDIKPLNIIHSMWMSKIIDLGLVLTVPDPKQTVQIQQVWGTPHYMDQYARTGLMDEKVDVFSLGISLAELTGLARGGKYNFEVVNNNDKEFQHNTQITDSVARQHFLKILQKMTDAHDSRLTVDEAIHEFKKMREDCLDTLALFTKVAFLNLEEFDQASDLEKKTIVEKLKMVEEIWLIGAAEGQELKYQQILKQLKGLNIRPETISGMGDDNQLMHSYCQQREESDVNIYQGFYVTANAALVNLEDILSDLQIDKVFNSITAESEKYKDDNNIQAEINTLLDYLRNPKSRNAITFDDIATRLTNLQHVILFEKDQLQAMKKDVLTEKFERITANTKTFKRYTHNYNPEKMLKFYEDYRAFNQEFLSSACFKDFENAMLKKDFLSHLHDSFYEKYLGKVQSSLANEKEKINKITDYVGLRFPSMDGRINLQAVIDTCKNLGIKNESAILHLWLDNPGRFDRNSYTILAKTYPDLFTPNAIATMYVADPTSKNIKTLLRENPDKVQAIVQEILAQIDLPLLIGMIHDLISANRLEQFFNALLSSTPLLKRIAEDTDNELYFSDLKELLEAFAEEGNYTFISPAELIKKQNALEKTFRELIKNTLPESIVSEVATSPATSSQNRFFSAAAPKPSPENSPRQEVRKIVK